MRPVKLVIMVRENFIGCFCLIGLVCVLMSLFVEIIDFVMFPLILGIEFGCDIHTVVIRAPPFLDGQPEIKSGFWLK